MIGSFLAQAQQQRAGIAGNFVYTIVRYVAYIDTGFRCGSEVNRIKADAVSYEQFAVIQRLYYPWV